MACFIIKLNKYGKGCYSNLCGGGRWFNIDRGWDEWEINKHLKRVIWRASYSYYFLKMYPKAWQTPNPSTCFIVIFLIVELRHENGGLFSYHIEIFTQCWHEKESVSFNIVVTSCVKLSANSVIVSILDECIPKLSLLANVFKLLKKEFEGSHYCLFFNQFFLSLNVRQGWAYNEICNKGNHLSNFRSDLHL